MYLFQSSSGILLKHDTNITLILKLKENQNKRIRSEQNKTFGLFLNPNILLGHSISELNGTDVANRVTCTTRKAFKLTIVEVEKKAAHVLVINLPPSVSLILGYDLVNSKQRICTSSPTLLF